MRLAKTIRQFFENQIEGPKIEDPVFGHIYWDSYWWYVNRVFAPTGKEIGVQIVTDGAEPEERHRSLYRNIESHYPLLKEKIVDALFDTLMQEFQQHSRHLLDKLKREDLWEQLRHEGISFENVDSRPYKWSLSYYCALSDCVYNIHMADLGVREVENIGG